MIPYLFVETLSRQAVEDG